MTGMEVADAHRSVVARNRRQHSHRWSVEVEGLVCERSQVEECTGDERLEKRAYLQVNPWTRSW